MHNLTNRRRDHRHAHQLNQQISQVLAMPEVKERLAAMGFETMPTTPSGWFAGLPRRREIGQHL